MSTNLVTRSDGVFTDSRAVVQHPAMDRQFRVGALMSTYSIFFSVFSTIILGLVYTEAWALIPSILFILSYITISSALILWLSLEDYRDYSAYSSLDKILAALFKNISQTREDILDKPINSVSPTEMLLRDKHPANDIVYYPEIQNIVLPVLSRKVVFNAFSVSIIVIHSLVYFFIVALIASSPPFISTAILGFTALVANYLWFLFYNRDTYLEAIKRKKMLFVPKRYIDMHYSEAHLMKLIMDPMCNEVLPCYRPTPDEKSKRVDNTVQMKKVSRIARWHNEVTLEELLKASFAQSRKINDLIRQGVIEPEFLAPEIKTLTHVNNFFIVEALGRTKTYLNKHSTYYDIAIKAFTNKVGGKLAEEIQTLHSSILKIDEAIERAKQMHIEDLESGLLSDESLNKLIEAEIVPISIFPELHSLKFGSVREKVAAFNIANEALPKLLKAKENTTNEAEKTEIDELIEDVKTYIKGTALDTDERQLILEQERLESESGLLGLVGSRSFSEADNVMGEVRNYIQGYKNSN